MYPLNRPASVSVARARALVLAMASAGLLSPALANPTLADMQRQLDELRTQYDARIQALEAQLRAAQQNARAVQSTPIEPQAAATETAAETPSGLTQPGTFARQNRQPSDTGFNPQVSLILSGLYTNLQRDPGTWSIGGFQPGGEEVGPGDRGFSLAESELVLSANIDPWFYGKATLAVTGDSEIEVEEAFVQTRALPAGTSVKAGRFYSGLGYLNAQHPHTWDFVDAPLVYQAMFGGQFKQDGVQGRWVLPTDQFVQLGLELGRGNGFPGTDRNRNAAGALTLTAHTGGDVGVSHSWRAGASWLQTSAQGREWADTNLAGDEVRNTFTGKSRIWALDGVWKWAPNGNATRTNFKLQGEYFRRTETGSATYDLYNVTENGSPAAAYRSAQSGWYVQGVYQFMPRWRVGLRHEQLDSGKVNYGSNGAFLSNPDHQPKRTSAMLDWSLSEFSRWRLQYNQDQVRLGGLKDNQIYLQYIMSLGAHGAHSF